MNGAFLPGRPPVPGRQCGSCALCCKTMGVVALDKPKGSWCAHCQPGAGCAIYPTRPGECRDFNCAWLTEPRLGEEWYPRRSRMVLVVEPDGQRLTVHVDEQRPDAWRRPPYHAALRALAREGAASRRQVVVNLAGRIFVVLPDRDVDLGMVGPEELVLTGERRTSAGLQLIAFKARRDDPRLVEEPSGGWAHPD
ncbi:MAG TPA: hypothetical protein VE684_13015 [Crenalkalicoccus sp.]|nr:hypothetical protein [Crenalkalicoccus sp.]